MKESQHKESPKSVSFKKRINIKKLQKSFRNNIAIRLGQSESQFIEDALGQIETEPFDTTSIYKKENGKKADEKSESVHVLQSRIEKLEYEFESKSEQSNTLLMRICDEQEYVKEKLTTLLGEIARKARKARKSNDNSAKTGFTIPNLQDTYSFVLFGPSSSSFLSFLVFCLQIACYFLVLSSFFFSSDFQLKVQPFPKGVDKFVHWAQGFAIIIILLILDSFWETASALLNGYDARLKLQGIQYRWWFISHLLRLIEVMFSVTATYLLVLYSYNVLDLFKDYTAITFVSSFDNICFVLAQMNVFGRPVKKTIERFSAATAIVYRRAETSKTSSSNGRINWVGVKSLFFHPTFFGSILLISMYSFWLFELVYPQLEGRLLCQKVYMQLDDDVNPDLTYFSGSYELLKGNDKRGWHPSYIESKAYEMYDQHNYARMILRFCGNIDSWVLALERSDHEEECKDDNLLVKSDKVEDIEKYDLFELSKEDWSVKQQNSGRWMPLKDVVLTCEDEEPKYSVEQTDVCELIEIDEREDPFESSRLWSTKFAILKHPDYNVSVYGHPVYTAVTRNNSVPSTDTQDLELILYLGKRWAMMSTNDLIDYQIMKDGNNIDLSSYFRTKFHAKWSNYTVEFFSETVTSDSTIDTLTPVGLSWVMASQKISGKKQRANDKRTTNSLFVCGKCNNETNPCFYEGICLPDQTCDCIKNSTGTLCQVLPINNGYCDEYFNVRDYNYDGGDCCQQTCVSSHFKCGRDKSQTFYAGYDTCNSDTCVDCWRLSEQPSNLRDLIVTDVSLSSSGRILALIESVGKSARVYDNDGSQWVMRGSTVMDIEVPSSSVIRVIGDEEIMSCEDSYPPATVAIMTITGIHVFDWNNTFWSENDRNIFNNGTIFPKFLELKNNGNSLGILYTNKSFRFFQRDHTSWPWKQISLMPNSTRNYNFFSLSNDATKIVLGNDICVEIYNILKNQTVSKTEKCKMNSNSITQIVLSPGGQKLGVSFDSEESRGEVQIFSVENNDFFIRENILRGIQKENIEFEVSNDGRSVSIFSNVNKLVQLYQFQNNKWTMSLELLSKRFALSTNRQVMVTTSNLTDSTMIYFYQNKVCETGSSNVRLSFRTDNSPNELRWELLNITSNGDIVVMKQGRPFGATSTMVVDDFCIQNTVVNNTTANCIGLRIVDLGLNGLKLPGVIGITINGTIKWSINDTDGYENIYGVLGNLNCVKHLKKDFSWTQKYDPSIHSKCLTTECLWYNIGTIEIGRIRKDWSNLMYSKFISMSADGTVICVVDGSQQVVIFKYSGDGVWTNYGILTRVNETLSDFSTSLSADGSIVAIMSGYSNEPLGRICIFKRNEKDGEWYQYGNTIQGSRTNIYLGTTISLSADGTILGYGTFKSSDENCIFKYSPLLDEWRQLGNCIVGGFNVKISSIGTIVIIGDETAYDNYGAVKVYAYNPITEEWNQLGNEIVGVGLDHYLGFSLAISADGSIIAVSGKVYFPAKIYSLNREVNEWQQRGQSIAVSNRKINNWYSLSLSSDGSVCIISSSDEVNVFVYDDIANEWKDSVIKFPATKNTGWDQAIATSADVVTVATVGDNSLDVHRLITNDGNGPKCNGYYFSFTINPDKFLEDISWFLQNQEGETEIGGKLPTNGVNSNDSIIYTKCLPSKDTSYLFYIEDYYGDGICCDWGNGDFTVKWDEKTVMDGHDFEKKKTICLPESSNLELLSISIVNFRDKMTLSVYDLYGNTLIERNGVSFDGENLAVMQCVPHNQCLKIVTLNMANGTSLFISINGELIQTFVPRSSLDVCNVGDCENIVLCEENHSLFDMFIGTGANPNLISWGLILTNNTILMTGGNYSTLYKVWHYQECFEVSHNECVDLTLVYSNGTRDSAFFATWNGKEKTNAKRSGSFEQVTWENCDCPENHSFFEIYLWTDNNPGEFSWEIVDKHSTLILGSGNYTLQNDFLLHRECVPVKRDECVTLFLYDSGGDGGFESNGWWNDDVWFQHDFASHVGPFDKVLLGNCTGGSLCMQNQSFFELNIVTDVWPAEFSWELRDEKNNTLASRDQFTIPYHQFYYRGCVEVSIYECATLLLYDNYYDGGTAYIVLWNGNEIANGVQGNYNLEFQLGNSC